MVIDVSSFFKHWTRPPKKQFPSYMVAYTGFQGDGKSLSLIQDVFEIKKDFPDCLIFSNMKIKGLDYTLLTDIVDLVYCLQVENGDKGILIVLDEAQNWFNKRGGIPMEIMSEFCQNRKNRRCILMTSQIWNDLDVPLRKQVKKVVTCRNYFKKLQVNTYSNGYKLSFDKQSGEYVAPKLYTKIFKHNDEYYDRYETLEKIQTNKEYDRTLTMAQGAPPAPVNVQLTYKKGTK